MKKLLISADPPGSLLETLYNKIIHEMTDQDFFYHVCYSLKMDTRIKGLSTSDMVNFAWKKLGTMHPGFSGETMITTMVETFSSFVKYRATLHRLGVDLELYIATEAALHGSSTGWTEQCL